MRRFSIFFFLSLSLVSFSHCTTKVEEDSEAGLGFSEPVPILVLPSLTSTSTLLSTERDVEDVNSSISGNSFENVSSFNSSQENNDGSVKVNRPIRMCPHKDSERLNQCLRDVLEEIKPRIAGGISEIGIPGIDPLQIPHLSFEHGSGSVKIMAQFNEVEITGLSKFNKSDFWIDIEKQTLDFDVLFPHTLLAGTYQLSGNLFFVPIAGNGHFWLNLGAVSSKGSGKLGSLTNGTHRRVVLHKTEVDLNIESIKVHLTDLFNGDRLLGSVINNFLNENSNEIFQELRPQIGSQVGEMLTLIANRALSALPSDYFDDLPAQYTPITMT